jgi:superfamily II DNA/RNA helicase
MKSPIVEFLTPEQKPEGAKGEEQKEYTEEEIFDISMANVINNASWSLTDVLITTPMTLSHVLKARQAFAPYDINPAIVVIDEIDLLLDSDEIDKKVIEILKKFATKRGPFAAENQKRQFIFSASTLTK